MKFIILELNIIEVIFNAYWQVKKFKSVSIASQVK